MPVSEVSIFNDPDDYQAALCRDVGVDLLVTGRGEFRAQLVRIALPHLSLSAGTEHLARVAVMTVASNMLRVSLPVRSGSFPVSGGVPYRPGEIITHGPGHRLLERTEGRCVWRCVWLATKDLAAYSYAVKGAALQVPVGELRWRPNAAALQTLTNLYDDGVRLTCAQPNVAAGKRAADGLEQQLILALIECLVASPAPEAAAVGDRRTKIMGRFDDYLATRVEWKIAVPKICAALGVSDRTLRAHCQTTVGMSPRRYFQLRRLQLARRALRASVPQTTTVSDVARRYGFESLGRFASDYRAQFGELPSATLVRQNANAFGNSP